LLLDDELARAVRTESAAAVGYWWGVSEGVVWRWREVLGVDRMNNAATHQLIKASAKAGAVIAKAREFTIMERQMKSQDAQRLNLVRNFRTGYQGPRWTAEQLALLNTLSDDEVARQTGRTPNAVRIMRGRVGRK
jgi:hypothetical protein